MAEPAPYNITLYQGDTYRLNLTVKDDQEPSQPINITGWSARGQIRPSVESATVLASFTVTFIDAAAGKIQFSLSAPTTAALTMDGVYDLEFTLGAGGDVETYLVGKMLLVKEVSR